MGLEKVCGSSCDLLKLDGATSTVWNYFGFLLRVESFYSSIKRKGIKCVASFALEIFSYVGNTTNM